MTDEQKLSKEVWYDRGIARRDAGELDDAIREMEGLARAFPDYPLAHLALAVFYGKKGRFDDSVAASNRACALESENPFYFTAASSLAIRAGRKKEAEDALRAAQELRFAEQWRKMGPPVAPEKSEQPEKAEQFEAEGEA